MLRSARKEPVGAYCLLLLAMLSIAPAGAVPTAGPGGRLAPPQSSSPCEGQIRPLNPAVAVGDPAPAMAGDPVGQALAEAFEAASGADWPAAIAAYQKAWERAACPCDRQLARAGQRAVREAWFSQRLDGMAVRPTQLFWSRLQYLTQALPCVKPL